MRIIGCDLHARQQTISMLDVETGEVTEKTLWHEGEGVREFYAALPKPALVGLEATGSMYWFLRLLEVWARRWWPRRESWAFGCGSCCATRSITPSSAGGQNNGAPMRECLSSTVVIVLD